MSLDETAQHVIHIITAIQDSCQEIMRLAFLILTKETINETIIEFSLEDKQKILQQYQRVKTQLQELVSQLP